MNYKYEPNLLKRTLTNLIAKDNHTLAQYAIRDPEKKKNIHHKLDKKCIIHDCSDDADETYEKILLDPRINIDKDLKKPHNKLTKRIFKYKIEEDKMKKFERIYADSGWRLLLKDYIRKAEYEDKKLDELFQSVPPRDQFMKLYKNQVENLIDIGFPNEKARSRGWFYFLDIQKLIELTSKKLNITFDDPIKEIFNHFVEESESEQNAIFSLIDNDLNFIQSEDVKEISAVKKIARAYFKWADLDVTTDTRKNVKYVYFDGILSLIRRLYNYFKDENDTYTNEEMSFWYIIGMAQTIELFRQPDPITNKDINYINEYAIVTKLIVECHCPLIYKKLLSLNFPIERFISTHLDSLYSDYFEDDLLFRLLDILIFQSIIKSNTQVYHCMRVLCAIPVTIFQDRQKKILQCQAISELDAIIGGIQYKSIKQSRFIQQLLANVNQFYHTDGLIKNLMKFSLTDERTKWDSKRDDILKCIYDHFGNIRGENESFLQKVLKDNIFPHSDDFGKNYLDILQNYLDQFRQLYGFGTAQEDGKILGVNVHIDKIKPIGPEDVNILKNNENLVLKAIFQKNVFKCGQDSYSDIKQDITYDANACEIISNKEQLFFTKDLTPTEIKDGIYLNLVLESQSGEQLASFSLDLNSIEFMKISNYTLQSRKGSAANLMLNCAAIKHSPIDSITPEDYTLFNTIFSEPIYANNSSIEDYYNPVEANSNREFNKMITTRASKLNKEKEEDIITKNALNLPNSDFMKIYFNKYNKANVSPDKNEFNDSVFKSSLLNIPFIKLPLLNNQSTLYKNVNIKGVTDNVKKILDSLLTNDTQSTTVLNWLKSGNASFEEILYTLILADKSIETVADKLYCLFQVAQMKDKLLLNNDKCNIAKIKEMIYALYKRFMIYFSKSDVDRMVDYEIKKEKLLNIKYALLFNEANSDSIKEIIIDKERYTKENTNDRDSKNYIEGACGYEDLTAEFNGFINSLINHYNVHSISMHTVEDILKIIIAKIKPQNFNRIKLVVARDNIQTEYNFNYANQKVEFKDTSGINPEKCNELIDNFLMKELTNLDIEPSYGEKNYLSFKKFRSLITKLPFLADSIRLALSYNNLKGTDSSKKQEYEKFELKIEFKGTKYGFFFPSYDDYGDNEYDSENRQAINTTIKSSDTLQDIKMKIINYYYGNNVNQSFDEVIKELKKPFKFSAYATSEEIKEEIKFFDNLGSCKSLKNSNRPKIVLKLNKDDFSVIEGDGNDGEIKEKKKGYAKFYVDHDPYDHFEWRNAKIKEEADGSKKIKLKCLNFKREITGNEDDVIEFI